MINARLLVVLAASSVAGMAYAQTQPAPSTQPSAPPGYNASHPHQQHMKSVPGNESAAPGSRPAPGSGLNTPQHSHRMNESLKLAEAGPEGTPWTQVRVQTSSGQRLGKITNVIPGLNGRKSSGYVLVSQSSGNGKSTPVPYPVAKRMVQHGALVLPKSRFEHAPKITQEALANRSDRAWRVRADRYWEHGSHSRPGGMK